MALYAYRDLLRSARIAFQGDARLLTGARSQARASYENNRQLRPSSDEAAVAIKHANDVAKLLRENVVQGMQVEGSSEQERYQLRIHEYTERGDNDSIKQGGRGMGASTLLGGCCGADTAR